MQIRIRKRPVAEAPAITSSERPGENVSDLRVTASGLIQLRDDWKDCTKCALGCRARKHVVIPDYFEFHNTFRADVLIIGEGPGESEDIIGKPFVGKAGILLRKAIEDADPSGLVIAFNNLVACRPQDKRAGANREPYQEEIQACSPRLERLIEIIDPVIILAAGSIPRHRLSYLLFECSDRVRLYESITHPPYIERIGGTSSKQYPAYVQKLKAVLESARIMKGN